MLELGKKESNKHSQILELVKSLGFNEIITSWSILKKVNVSEWFLTTIRFNHYLTENEIHLQNILLKASMRNRAEKKALEFIIKKKVEF